MSSDGGSTTFSSWQNVAETVGVFHAQCSDIEQFLDGLFAELDELRIEFTTKLSEISDERNRLAAREQAMEGQVADFQQLQEQKLEVDATVDRLQGELESARNDLQQERQQRAEDRSSSEVEAQLSETLNERDALRQQLSDIRSEVERLSLTEQELQAARQALENHEQEIEQLRSSPVAASAVEIDSAEVTALEEERDELADELELVRSRAAELENRLSEQQRNQDQERLSLSQEVKELRRLMSERSESLQHTPPAEVAVPHSAPATASAKADDPSDAVVNSVMAQFAKLQKDVASRRRQNA